MAIPYLWPGARMAGGLDSAGAWS